jgi:3-dehydroquinate synthase
MGEASKSLDTFGRLLQTMLDHGFSRKDCVAAVGGGVVGDIAGLAAALYMRGISCVQIPTTLLSQVDSSVGGKTAVDLGGVKNVDGAFYQPCEVLVAPSFLESLPQREIKCGMGEIVKYAALNAELYSALTENAERLGDLAFLQTLVAACIRHKARVVEADEKEMGERKSLNVGHTTGHAIELTSGLSHGESVLYGMRFETQIAVDKGVCEREYGEKLLCLIDKALSVTPVTEMDFSGIGKDAEKARADKKNADDGNIRLAVAKAKGEWTMLSLSFEEYRSALIGAVQKWTREREK